MDGFAETSKGLDAPRPGSVRIKVGPDGRILIPAELRRAAGLEPGVTVLVDLKDGELRIATSATRVRQLQALFAPFKRPGVSEVDEFIAERRAEAARE